MLDAKDLQITFSEIQKIIVEPFKESIKNNKIGRYPRGDERQKLIDTLILVRHDFEFKEDTCPIYKMLIKRLDMYKLNLDDKLKYLLCKLYWKDFGFILLYLYYFNYIQTEKKISMITFEMFLSEDYLGIIEDEALKLIWEGQRYRNGNAILSIVDILPK